MNVARSLLLALSSIVFALPIASAQDKAPAAVEAPPAWDVISVKPSSAEDGRVRVMYTPDGFHAQGISLKMLAADAYGVRRELVSGGPKWIDSSRFDIDAKVADVDAPRISKLTQDERHLMLLALLSERFHWQAHSETKDLPVYELVVARGGPKLKESKPEETPADASASGPNDKRRSGMMTMGPGEISATGSTLAGLARMLASEVQRNVIDKTGLTGSYDFALHYTSDRQGPPAAHGDNGQTGTDSEASVFTALEEQLGLKLQPARGPVETIVIDEADAPAQN